jgi:hypothetical protein
MDSFASDITPATRNSDNAETRCVNKVVQVMFILYVLYIYLSVCTYEYIRFSVPAFFAKTLHSIANRSLALILNSILIRSGPSSPKYFDQVWP